MRPITVRIDTLIPPVDGWTHGDAWRGYRAYGEAWREGDVARCEPGGDDSPRTERYDPVATEAGTLWPIGAYRWAWSPPEAGTAQPAPL